MSVYDFYQRKMKIDSNSTGKNYPTLGEKLKHDSDVLMESTWNSDLQSKVCYIYDYFHDDQPHLKDHMTYENTTKTRIDAKFIITQYGSINKDQVAYHLMFKPSQPLEFNEGDELYYFETDYRKKYDIPFPFSLYIDIPNEKGIYEKWLIINAEQGNQFIKYNILPINYRFEWVETSGQNRYKRRMWGCDRQQLSYTSGVWLDRYINSLDNVDKAYLPLNDITENINYVDENSTNQRMIISAKTKHPLAWKLTKLENTKPIGLLQLTFSQTSFDQNNDYIEKDDDGNIIGMWADYYESTTPTDPDTPSPTPSTIYGKITASTSTIKVGGSYKTLTLKLYDVDGNEVTDNYSSTTFDWTCHIKGNEADDLSDKITWLNGSLFNQKKIKFSDDRSYLNKILVIKCVVDGIETVEEFELIGT